MAVDMFLKIDSIQGESQDAAHKDEIQVLSWQWGANQTGTSGQGGGLGAGKVEIQDMEIRKKVDRASPVLYKFCCNGKHITSADLTIRKAGGDALEYMKVHLEDLIVSSYELDGAQADDGNIEILRINFTRAAITYTPQLAGGGGGPAVSGGWDLKANKEFEPK
jgi:type VI secretion system secreted protein Hcp